MNNATPPHHGLLLTQRGRIIVTPLADEDQHYQLTGPTAGTVDEAYVTETGARFWLPEPLKPGWLHLHVEGDPEPVTTREPRGYGSALVARLIGNFYAHLFGATRRPEEDRWKHWITTGLIAIASASLAAGVVYWYLSHGAK